MSDKSALSTTDPSVIEADPAPTTPRPSPRKLFAWLYGFGWLILAAAIFYVWQYPSTPIENVAVLSDMSAANEKLGLLDARLTRLEEQQKQSAAVSIDKITSRLDALDRHADTIDASASDQTRLASRLDVLSGRIESLSGGNQTAIDVIKQQLEGNSGRLTALEKKAGGLEATSARIDQIARIQAAALALSNGQPLGDLPGAPPAVSRYAHAAPPTESHLRLTFPQMERAALAAAEPGGGSGPLIDRVWERAQGLVTIRQGDEVLLGNSSAMSLSHARVALEAGDVTAAVRAMTALSPNALRAASDWLAEAKALVDARLALTDMAVRI
jgi:hypothetical protein